MTIKKILSLTLAIVIAMLTLSACGGEMSDEPDVTENSYYVPVKLTCESKYGNVTIDITLGENKLPAKEIHTSGEKTIESLLYSYDEFGRIIEKKPVKSPDDENSTSGSSSIITATLKSSTETYSYDENGKLVKVIYTYDQDDVQTQEIFYDDRGNQIKSITTDADGVVMLSNYSYNSKNQITSTTIESNGYTWSYENSYDSNGNLVKETVIENGEVYTTTTYTYDESSRPIKKTVVTPEIDYNTYEEVQKTYEYVYTYDSKGNWIKLEQLGGGVYDMTYDENGNAKTLVVTSDEETYTFTFEYELITVPFVWQNTTKTETERLYYAGFNALFYLKQQDALENFTPSLGGLGQ